MSLDVMLHHGSYARLQQSKHWYLASLQDQIVKTIYAPGLAMNVIETQKNALHLSSISRSR
jgi:hypothetical protein